MTAQVLAFISLDCAAISAALAQRACVVSLNLEERQGVAWIARCLLVAGGGFLLWSKAV